MNNGNYLEDLENTTPTDFCIGAAGYPEKHYESPNLERDLLNLKKKVDNGAEYVITQMFYNFDSYKNFVEKAREIGINVPIIPGIKPITSKKQVLALPSIFNISMPEKLVSAICDAKSKEQEFDAGIKYMTKLLEQLLDYGIPGIHLFTMGKNKSSKALLNSIFGKNR